MGQGGRMKMSAVCAVVVAASMTSCGAFGQGEAGGARPTPRENMKVGGSCEYVDYTGTATITRMMSTDQSRVQATTLGGAGYPGFEIWFSFKTDAKIAQDWARKVVEREHPFRLANSWYPGERYINKYGIKVGNVYPCTLKIITRGTCTPAIFKFPGDKDRDYFESKKEE